MQDVKPETPLAPLLGRTVMGAIPLTAHLTAGGLTARVALDVCVHPGAMTCLKPIREPKIGKSLSPRGTARHPRVHVHCILSTELPPLAGSPTQAPQ